jgi:tetratricopeptide (TPR) repeat protein
MYISSPRMMSSFPYRPVGGFQPAAQPMVTSGDTFTAVAEIANFQEVQAEQYKNAGNEFRKHRHYTQAIMAYESSIRANPRYVDAYYNYAQLMVLMGNMKRGIQLMTQLLYVSPNDHDARVTLGEYYEKSGNTQEAKKRYMEVLQARPDFDPARRRLDFLLYRDQKRFLPETAGGLLDTRYREIIHKARELLKQYYTVHHPNPTLCTLSQRIPIVFEDTQQVGESANIAEYDAPRGVVRIQPQMLFSQPNVVAAYLAHELNHVVDNDTESSVLEEQDGYRDLAHFWSIYQGAENDPNLDRALALYQKSPDALDQEVRRVYTIRTPDMPETSPGHGRPPNTWVGRVFQEEETRAAQIRQEQLNRLLTMKYGVAPSRN